MTGDTKQGQDPDTQHPGHSEGGGNDERAGIAIKLTPSQIDRVVRDAAGAGNMSVLLSGRAGMQDLFARATELLSNPNISSSLMRGLLVLAALHVDESYIGVVELAGKLGMSASTTHRYLATLVEAGLVERHASSRRYRPAK